MHRDRGVVVCAALLTAALTACSSSGQSGGSATTGGSPTPSATSTTFTSTISPLPGLQLTWPTPGWRPMDGAAQVIVYPPGLAGAALYVTKGLFPADADGTLLTTRTSAAAVINALRRTPALRTSRPVREHIGDGLAAVHVDMRLSPSASASGYEYLVYKGASVMPAAFTIKAGMSVRVYAATYHAPYGRELLDIAVQAPSGKVFRRWTALAARALQSLRLPKGFVPGRAIYN